MHFKLKTVLLIFLFTQQLFGQDFKKNEIEMKPSIGFSMSNGTLNFLKIGAEFQYRRMISKHLGVDVGIGHYRTASGNSRFSSFNETNFLMGLTYFVKSNEKGFFINSGVKYNSYNGISGYTGLGYRFAITKNIFLGISTNIDYNYPDNKIRFNLDPNIGIGFRF